jgi:hypothetical protein
MASTVYNAAWRHRGHYGGHGGFGHRRTWGGLFGSGSWFGGIVPRYIGAGQPTADAPEELPGNGTPVYRIAPSMGAPPSQTPSAPTAPQPAPQPGQVAIVVPRS